MSYIHFCPSGRKLSVNAPRSFNDYRPEILTSLAMKAFEKTVKEELLTTVQTDLEGATTFY